ncbi:MAG: tetratricopeptide repeat protein [Pirellulaceae bacterium]
MFEMATNPELFSKLLPLSLAERMEFLNQEFGENSDAKAQILSELALADAKSSTSSIQSPPNADANFLARNETFDHHSTEPSNPRRSNIIAPDVPGIRIDSEIARGGMGCVYKGIERDLDRDVAVKVTLPGANAKRFVNESRITAQLPHPGIPPVHRIGTLADGAHYLVMKLIRGQTLADLLDSRKSASDSLSQWLQVFEQIAFAVGFAHAEGIVHRDLKPANIMVSEFNEVQVMDWGLAKRIGQTETDEIEDTIAVDILERDLTMAGSVMGTPGYMAPEQAKGEPATFQSDVFALGGILCKILTGHPIVDGNDVVEIIERTANGRFENAFQSLDKCGAEPELIRIAKRCLSLEQDERPPNGKEVANQIVQLRANADQRAREAEANRARAEVEANELKKRRRTLALASGILLTILTAGIVGTSYGFVTANAARNKAEEAERSERDRAESEALARKEADDAKLLAQQKQSEAETARDLAASRQQQTQKALDIANLESEWAQTTLSFLVNDVILQADAYRQFDAENVTPNLTILEAIDRAEPRIPKRIEGRAHIEPAFRAPIGESYLALGQFDKAVEQLSLALDGATKSRGANDEFTLRTARSLASAYHASSQFELAIPIFQETLNRFKQKLGADNDETLVTALFLGQCQNDSGDIAGALQTLTAAFESAKNARTNQSLLLDIQLALANVQHRNGNGKEAITLFSDAVDRFTELYGEDDLRTLTAKAWLGWVEYSRQRYDVALPLFEAAYAGRVKQLGPRHPHTLLSTDNLGSCLVHMGQYERGIPLIKSAFEGRKEIIGVDNQKTFWSLMSLAAAYLATGEIEAARDLYQTGFERQSALFGDTYPSAITCLANWVHCELELNHPDLAEPIAQRAYDTYSKKYGEDHPNTWIPKLNVGLAKLGQGKIDEAIELFDSVIAAARQAEGYPGYLRVEFTIPRIECEIASGRREVAIQKVRELQPLIHQSYDAGSVGLAGILMRCAKIMVDANDIDAARDLCDEAAAIYEEQKFSGWEATVNRGLLAICNLANSETSEDAVVELEATFDQLHSPELHLPPIQWAERQRIAKALAEHFEQSGESEKARSWAEKASQSTVKKEN